MIRVDKLNKIYDKGRRNANRVLRDVSFELPETGFVCILGASGCGKTSLLNAIGGLDTFQGGTVTTGAVTASRYGTAAYEAERNRSFGYIFQNYYLLMDHSVGYNVYMGLHNLELSHSEKLKRVKKALEAVEMERYIRRTVSDLSGGQQQRVAIARALARRPRVIFADEPTGNLDEANTLKICTLLRKISRSSLVVMVTHEERLANFFADRIITLEAGNIAQDITDWPRQSIPAETGKTVYAGDYEETTLDADGLHFRLLREAGAAPVKLTLVVEEGRIIVKLDDNRTTTLGRTDAVPALQEGKRPELSLEVLDRERDLTDELFAGQPPKSGKSGQGIGIAMMLREARRLASGKGIRNAGMKLFLVLLTVLTLVIVSDYLQVASLNPEDFINTDPHLLEIQVAYGSEMTEDEDYLSSLVAQYLPYLRQADQDWQLVPVSSAQATYTTEMFLQLGSQTIKFTGFSYIPLDYFDESTLVCGRMPENSSEIVVDRWVLDAALRKDGILENSIPDYTYFLDKTITYLKMNYAPTIVGICDSGSPAVYMPLAGVISLGGGNTEVMPLSELQAMYPGTYDDVVLGDGECLVNVSTAGISYYNRIGSPYRTTTRTSYTIVDAFRETGVYARVVVRDEDMEDLLWDVVGSRFFLYCEDKEAAREFLRQKSPLEEAGNIKVTVKDRYAETMSAYRSASTLKADARTIVTVTVIAVAMVMLYLLCRAQTQQRIGMLAVYRLLGVPNGKLVTIFTLEAVLTSLVTALPAAAVTWAGVELAKLVPDWEIGLLLPWQAALGVYGVILVYHVIVSLLPTRRLLSLPPAQLAAKYDI